MARGKRAKLRAQQRERTKKLKRAEKAKKQEHDPKKWEAKKAARDRRKKESGLS